MELLETEHIAAVATTVALGALAVLAARLWPERRAAALCLGLALGVLVFGRGLPPRPGAAWRAFAATAAMAALAAAGNRITGGNYMFLREKPDNSLLDLMGPWPWYIAVAAAFGLALFALLQALARSTSAGRRCAQGGGTTF